jgi:amino acid transporter
MVATIVSFAVIGIYAAFQMIVLGALYARLRGWSPAGQFRLGRWGMAVNVAALVWGIGAIVNMVWLRAPDQPWFINAAMLLTLLVVVGVGVVYMVAAAPYRRGVHAAGDAG